MRQFPKVRIVGAGLTGLVCALEAHRQGARDITLIDAYDHPGGGAWPATAEGLEVQEIPLVFGPRGEAVRDLFEQAGVAFEEVENRRGAVSPAPGGDLAYRRDFPGPSLACRELTLGQVDGESLADRLRAYPDDLRAPLARYAQQRLGRWLDEAHGVAAEALGFARVRPLGVDPADLARLKRENPTADALLGLPAEQWGRLANLTAGLPRDGARAFFVQARQALQRLDVTLVTNQLISPREALSWTDDVTIWAADPAPLFKPTGLDGPGTTPRRAVTYVLKARHPGQAPLEIRSFVPEGVVSNVRFYEHRGHGLLAAECAAEIGERDLRRELHRLTAGFCGGLVLGETIATAIGPRWDTPTVDAVRKLRGLRATLARSHGASFICPDWETPRLSKRLPALSAKLQAAFDRTADAAAA